MATVSVSLPADGTTIDAADYNTPITTIVNEINGNLDNANIDSAAAISGSKLADSSVTADKLDLGADSETQENTGTTTSTSFTATLSGTPGTNPSVTVDIGDNGLALVILTANIANSTANTAVRMGFAMSGANTVAASDAACMQHADPTASSPEQGSWGKLFTGLTPGSTTFTLQYRVSAGTGTFLNRSISVIPL